MSDLQKQGHRFVTVVIEEYYQKINGRVYRVWRFTNAKDVEWKLQLTPYEETPFHIMSPDQFEGTYQLNVDPDAIQEPERVDGVPRADAEEGQGADAA